MKIKLINEELVQIEQNDIGAFIDKYLKSNLSSNSGQFKGAFIVGNKSTGKSTAITNRLKTNNCNVVYVDLNKTTDLGPYIKILKKSKSALVVTGYENTDNSVKQEILNLAVNHQIKDTVLNNLVAVICIINNPAHVFSNKEKRVFDIAVILDNLNKNLNAPIRESYLTEEDVKTIGELAGMDNSETVKVSKDPKKMKGTIEKALDELLATAENNKILGEGEYQSLMIVGPAGTGKTKIINQWAKDNNINLYTQLTSALDDGDVGGAIIANKEDGVAQKLPTNLFDALDRPNSVLFLDEFNRGSVSVRNSLLYLVNEHEIQDARVEGGMRHFDNLLFVVAAMNPSSDEEEGWNTGEALDWAEKSRFRHIKADFENVVQLNFYKKKFNEQIQRAEEAGRPDLATAVEGRLKIATTLLQSSEFQIDSPDELNASLESGNGLGLDARNLTKLLTGCNGTKKDFLAKWDEYLDSNKKSIAERLLKDYTDVKNKANDALKYGTNSKLLGGTASVFGQKKESVWDKIYSHL